MLLAGLLLALTGCAIGSPVPTQPPEDCGEDMLVEGQCMPALSFEEMTAEWQRSANSLEVPDGTLLTPPSREAFGEGAQYFERGYGQSIAEAEWFCLWQQEWLTLHDRETTEADLAMSQMQSFLATDTFGHTFRADPLISNAVEAAADGDSALIRRYFDLNC